MHDVIEEIRAEDILADILANEEAVLEEEVNIIEDAINILKFGILAGYERASREAAAQLEDKQADVLSRLALVYASKERLG